MTLRQIPSLIGVVCCFLFLVACSDDVATQPTSPVPTVTFVIPTATHTTTPTPTPSPVGTVQSPLDMLPNTPTVAVPAFLPPDVQPIVNAVLDASQTESGRLRLLGIKRVRWADADFTCQSVDQNTLAIPGGLQVLGVSGYRVMVGTTEGTSAVVYFTNATGSRLLRCEDANLLDTSGDALAINLFAQELITLAKQDLARQLGVVVGSIRVASAFAITWTDSSLGCPAEGQNYQVQITDGYRIVLAYRDALYPYHADFSRVQACPAGQEALPVPFAPTATPTITPTPPATIIPTPA